MAISSEENALIEKTIRELLKIDSLLHKFKAPDITVREIQDTFIVLFEVSKTLCNCIGIKNKVTKQNDMASLVDIRNAILFLREIFQLLRTNKYRIYFPNSYLFDLIIDWFKSGIENYDSYPVPNWKNS